MRDHQKYFAVENQHGVLQSRFIAFLNCDGDPEGLIKRGHERVLRARFADALFFWNADKKRKFEDRCELLSRVTYQAELGSYAEKVQRMEAIGTHLAKLLEAQKVFSGDDSRHALRAIALCKCDLTTQMVQEFPELQGIVGGLYTAQSEAREVSEAIYDHYLPQGAEDRCPRSLVGAVVSLADKIDSVVAGFAVGHQPTSSGDPFGLRRDGNGIIKVLLELNLPIDLSELLQQYHAAIQQGGWFGIQTPVPWHRVLLEVLQFFDERLRYHLESVRGLRVDKVRAVIAAAPKIAGIAVIAPTDALHRAEALEALRGSQDLDALCAGAKRIRNILTKSATAADWEPGEVDTKLWQERGEEELYRAYLKVAEEAATLAQGGEYRQALETIAGLRPAVDRFFDKVLVMAEDRKIRQNRLRLLKKLDELFSGIAHFAEIASESRG
jgi:glycyl-tRNA synthetase beta chain